MKILSRLKTISSYDEFDGVKESCGFAFNSKKYPFLLKALEEKGLGNELEQEKYGKCDYFIDNAYCNYSGSYERNFDEPNHLEVDIEEVYIGKTPLSKILSPSDFKKVMSELKADEFEFDSPSDYYIGVLTLE